MSSAVFSLNKSDECTAANRKAALSETYIIIPTDKETVKQTSQKKWDPAIPDI